MWTAAGSSGSRSISAIRPIMQIDGKTALITGGASGLGAASTRMIVASGGRVVIADVKPNSTLASELGDAAIFARADVTDAGHVKAAIDMAGQGFGGPPIPVHCAG